MIDLLRRSLIGLGFTAIFTFTALTILKLLNVDAAVSDIWLSMLGSMVMGIYFGASSKLFEVDQWSPLKQTSIHFLLSIFLWFPLALYIGWLPFNFIPIVLGVAGFIVVYLIFWFAFYSYFKKLESEMNNTVKR
ncbi:DUF3021 domain-containing protein [Rossellomorea vietnamensis]|uniref:DUF3021 domain-containing protein n=1 Tax=Rossellomorea vietnamensis TaxID=218284 RepID=A0A5D4MI32_9BACI|nr:DUF3021 domain-containing protein [Rossellomorea vietnamensis]TYS01228.1 DUF3021 domain-containing protein [Rossellomorea vietnamensis]